jgi:MFS family permease
MGTLAAMSVLGIFNHILLAGGRVVVSLDALALGASPAVVGVLMALFAILPMLLSVAAGRLADRVGPRRPMLWGSAGCALAALLPAGFPGLPALFAASMIAGVSFMLFQVPAQRAIGDLGSAADRAANFSWYALAFSVSGFVAPLIAGFAIDRLGFRWAFALLAAFPVAAAVVLATRRVALPQVHPPHADEPSRSMLDLLRHPMLRRLLLLNALFALGWDLHTIFVPIYGTRIGLSAAEIGGVLSAFAAATFVVRLAVPWLGRDLPPPMRVLRIALFMAGAVYAAFPFTSSTLALIVLSFVLGLGLGLGQPMVMSLLHDHAPAGRVGETVGLRMSLIQTMAVAVPLVFGTLGTTVGLVPVFGAVGLFLGLGGLAARRATSRDASGVRGT